MLLRNDECGRNALQDVVLDYFEGKRPVYSFLWSEDGGIFYNHFILDRRWVFRVGLGEDRGTTLACLEFSIGPHYFMPHVFCDQELANKFSIEPSVDAIRCNLSLLEDVIRERGGGLPLTH